MSNSNRVRLILSAVAVAVLALSADRAFTQSNGQPVNDAPNPYQTIEGWAKMPEGRTWGSTSAVDIAPDGRSVWVAERCGGDSCARSELSARLPLDATSQPITSI